MKALVRWGTAAVTALVASACASVGRPVPTGDDPAVQARLAVMALQREDFESARRRLLELAARCDAGAYGRRAILLLAAAELDPENEAGSPRAAADLTRVYLELPDSPREDQVLARTLYRVAADLGGLEGSSSAPELLLEVCGAGGDTAARPLPSTPEVTTAERLRALEAEAHAARTQASTSAERVAELEAEIRRITDVLTSGTPSTSAQRPER